MTVYTREGWVVADRDQQPRPDTTMEGLSELRTPFRPLGKVTAGNSSVSTMGPAGCSSWPRTRRKRWASGRRCGSLLTPMPGSGRKLWGSADSATHKVLKIAGLTMKDLGLIELNEALPSSASPS